MKAERTQRVNFTWRIVILEELIFHGKSCPPDPSRVHRSVALHNPKLHTFHTNILISQKLTTMYTEKINFELLHGQNSENYAAINILRIMPAFPPPGSRRRKKRRCPQSLRMRHLYVNRRLFAKPGNGGSGQILEGHQLASTSTLRVPSVNFIAKFIPAPPKLEIALAVWTVY